jgi:hypothetical protein
MYAERGGDGVVIRDGRRIASLGTVALTGRAARIYEFCDRARGVDQVGEMCREFGGGAASRDEVASTLNELVDRRLMVEEGGRYLSLAVMTYETDFDTRDRHATTGQSEARRSQIPLTVVEIEAGAGTGAAIVSSA